MASCVQRILRKKCTDDVSLDTPLRRCYNTLDLTLLGVGSMVGSGIYVIVGTAAKELAGPSIVISFLVAAVLVALTGACFAEFACRVPKTGSTYLYMYYSLGEIWAFLAGWGILCVSLLSAAVNAKAWSGYFDSIFDHKIRNLTKMYVANWDVGEPIGEYPDFLAFGLIWVVTIVVILGAQCTAKFTSVFAILNILVLLFVTVSGFAMGNTTNWTSNSTGGFLPFGWHGVFAGSGSCFWAFTGFEIIAVSNEEVKDPSKMIPLGILLAIFIVTILYVGTASGLTLMTSYLLLDTTAPLPSAFLNTRIPWGKYIASVGPLFGLTTALVTTLYAYSRLLYAMSSDGLLPYSLAKLNSRTRAPLLGVLLGGAAMSLLSVFLDLKNIISFAVNLQLIQYLTICSCVIIMRYRPAVISEPSVKWSNKDYITDTEDEVVLLDVPKATLPNLQHSNHNSKHSRNREHSSLSSDDSLEKTEPVNTAQNTQNAEVNSEKEQLLSDQEDIVTKGNTFSNHTPKTPSSDLVLTQPASPEEDDAIQAGKLKPSFSWMRPFWFLPAGRCIIICLVLAIITMLLLVLTLVHSGDALVNATWWLLLLVIFMSFVLCILALVIFAHIQNIYKLPFKMPCIPWLPLVADFLIIMICVTSSTPSSWIGSAIVFISGVLLYFAWGYRHSEENARSQCLISGEEEQALLSESDA